MAPPRKRTPATYGEKLKGRQDGVPTGGGGIHWLVHGKTKPGDDRVDWDYIRFVLGPVEDGEFSDEELIARWSTKTDEEKRARSLRTPVTFRSVNNISSWLDEQNRADLSPEEVKWLEEHPAPPAPPEGGKARSSKKSRTQGSAGGAIGMPVPGIPMQSMVPPSGGVWPSIVVGHPPQGGALPLGEDSFIDDTDASQVGVMGDFGEHNAAKDAEAAALRKQHELAEKARQAEACDQGAPVAPPPLYGQEYLNLTIDQIAQRHDGNQPMRPVPSPMAGPRPPMQSARSPPPMQSAGRGTPPAGSTAALPPGCVVNVGFVIGSRHGRHGRPPIRSSVVELPMELKQLQCFSDALTVALAQSRQCSGDPQAPAPQHVPTAPPPSGPPPLPSVDVQTTSGGVVTKTSGGAVIMTSEGNTGGAAAPLPSGPSPHVTVHMARRRPSNDGREEYRVDNLTEAQKELEAAREAVQKQAQAKELAKQNAAIESFLGTLHSGEMSAGPAEVEAGPAEAEAAPAVPEKDREYVQHMLAGGKPTTIVDPANPPKRTYPQVPLIEKVLGFPKEDPQRIGLLKLYGLTTPDKIAAFNRLARAATLPEESAFRIGVLRTHGITTQAEIDDFLDTGTLPTRPQL